MTAPYGPPPGWYPDPDGTPGRARWWDGLRWSDATTSTVSPGAGVPPVPTGPLAGGAPGIRSGGPARWDPGVSPAPRSRRTLWWLLSGAGVVVLVVVVALVVWLLPRITGPVVSTGADPTQSGPPLAALCPPPSGPPRPAGPAPAPPAGPRVEDPVAGISYAAQPRPWRAWDQEPWSHGTLGVEFRTGYFFVTERYAKGQYLASVLSGAVPATVNDGLTLDLECAGKQVAEDVRTSYYPVPNRKQVLRDEATTVGGRPAWVSVFRLSFREPTLTARSELVGVVVVDVGRPTAAVLYLSIPGTHRQYEPVVSRVISSVRPL
jgi:hypothetical protein